MHNLIPRKHYLEKLKKWTNKRVVKVVSGMRRTGKSSLLKLFINELKKNGIEEKNIIYINKELFEFDELKTYRDLYEFVLQRVKSCTTSISSNSFERFLGYFIIIDEVQEIKEWERAVASFLAEGADVTIAGSNSKLLGSDLSHLLSGRYVEINVYPLTFSEFLDFRKKLGKEKVNSPEEAFKQYLKYGGLPAIHILPFEGEVIFQYLASVLDTILYKDVIGRHKIKNVAVFDRVVRYLFDNIGNITSAKKISDFLKSQNLKTSVDTVISYMKALQDAHIIHQVERFNIKGKRQLELYHKIYITDVGLRNSLLGYRYQDLSGILENIVYMELLSRGYKVWIGKVDNLEVDFVVRSVTQPDEIKYIQVCYLLADEAVVEREFKSLLKIKDNYEKVVMSLDKFFPSQIEGVKHVYLLDFLSKTIN